LHGEEIKPGRRTRIERTDTLTLHTAMSSNGELVLRFPTRGYVPIVPLHVQPLHANLSGQSSRLDLPQAGPRRSQPSRKQRIHLLKRCTTYRQELSRPTRCPRSFHSHDPTPSTRSRNPGCRLVAVTIFPDERQRHCNLPALLLSRSILALNRHMATQTLDRRLHHKPSRRRCRCPLRCRCSRLHL
jgi:hypothetical protein